MNKLGIDIGGVIINRRNDKKDKAFFTVDYLKVPAVSDAFTTISRLVEQFDGNVFLISSCTEQVELNTLEWFRHYNFFTTTGVNPKNTSFCRGRGFKAPICKDLGITHFIDDRMEVLRTLNTVKKRYLFCPDPQKEHVSADDLLTIYPVNSWNEILMLSPLF